MNPCKADLKNRRGVFLAKIVPLFSGSKGNSYCIECSGEVILIDAGRSCKQLVTALSDNDIDISKIHSVFVTHEHTDHCSGLDVLARKLGLTVYGSAGTIRALRNSGKLTGKVKTKIIETGIESGSFFVERTDTPHDAAESCCFTVTTPDDRVCTVATDMGYMTDAVRQQLAKSDFCVIESNHDVNMLRCGPYPYPLKRRILSDVGHLSNISCATEIANLVKHGTARFLLAHLSRENNTPELAYQTAMCEFLQMGLKPDKDFTLDVAPEATNGKKFLY